MRFLSGVLCVVGLFAVGCVRVQPSTQAPARRVSVHGSATVQLTPDRVTLSMGVESRGPTVPDASRMNKAKVLAVLEALKQKGIDLIEVETSYPNVIAVNNADGVPVAYKVGSQVSLTREASTDVGDLIQAGVAAGVTSVSNLKFFLADPTASQKKGLELAILNARAKAETMASRASWNLGDVISVTDDTSSGTADMISRLRATGAGNVDGGPADLTFNVSVLYELK